MGVIVSTALEIIENTLKWPEWTRRPDTRFLVIQDVPIEAVFQIPTILAVHKPGARIFLTGDWNAVRRLVIAQLRDNSFDGLVQAYFLSQRLYLLRGDLQIIEAPVDQIGALKRLKAGELQQFEIDLDGSFIHWPAADLHLTISGILQEIDPEYLAELEIQRIRKDSLPAALALLREQFHATQADINGLSERQVRRLEKGVSRLTVDAAEKLAVSLGLSLREFLERISQLARELDSHSEKDREGERSTVGV